MPSRFGDSDLQEAPAVNRFGDSVATAAINRFGDSVASSGVDNGSSEISTPPDYGQDGTTFTSDQPPRSALIQANQPGDFRAPDDLTIQAYNPSFLDRSRNFLAPAKEIIDKLSTVPEGMPQIPQISKRNQILLQLADPKLAAAAGVLNSLTGVVNMAPTPVGVALSLGGAPARIGGALIAPLMAQNAADNFKPTLQIIQNPNETIAEKVKAGTNEALSALGAIAPVVGEIGGLRKRLAGKTPEQAKAIVAQETKLQGDTLTPEQQRSALDLQQNIDDQIASNKAAQEQADAQQKAVEDQQRALEQQQKAQADAAKQEADAQEAANEVPKSTQILQESSKPPVLANVATEAATQTSPFALQGKLNEITAVPAPSVDPALAQIAPEAPVSLGIASEPNAPAGAIAPGSRIPSQAEINFNRRKALFDARKSAEKQAASELPQISREPAGPNPPGDISPRQLAARMRQESAGVKGVSFKAPMAEETAPPFETPKPTELPTAEEIKSADIKKAVTNPETEYQFTVQQGEEGHPGYVQVDAILTSAPDAQSRNTVSSSVKDLNAAGAKLPEVPNWVPTGQYTRAEIEALIKQGEPKNAIREQETASGVLRPEEGQPQQQVGLQEVVSNDRPKAPAGDVARGETQGQPQVNRFGDSNPTSIKNAIVADERAARNIRPAEEAARRSFGTVWDEAGAKIAADSQAAVKLADELRNKPRAIDDTEDALLLHRQIELQSQFDETAKRINESPHQADPADQLALSNLSDQLLDLYDINKKAGTETGRGLNARKLLANEDFSLAKMTTAKRAAKGGRVLTPKETAEIKAQSDRIASTGKAYEEKIKELDDRNAKLEADNAILRIIKESKTGSKKPSQNAVVKFIGSLEQSAIDRINARRAQGRVQSGLDPIDLADHAIVGAGYIARGVRDLAAWGKSMIERFGDRIKPDLNQIWEASKSAHETLAARAGEGTKNAIDQIRAKVTKGAPLSDMTYYVQKLARELVESGVTDRNKLVDAVHESLKEIAPELTRRQAMDAISGYGIFKQLTKDQVSIQLRDIKGQLQQVAKLEDMASGKSPTKTGIERRIPTQAESELIKQVNIEKAKGGYNVTDPATQLRSQLQSAETRANNTIAELERQLRTNELFTAAKRTPQTNAIIEAKKAQIEILKQEREYARHHLQPGAEPPTDIEARVKQLDAQVAKIEIQLRSGEIFSPETKKAPITSPEIKAREETLAQLKQEREYLRDSIQSKPDPLNSDQRALAQVKKNLIKRTAELQDKLARGDFSTKPRRNVVLDEEAQKFKAENARAKQAYQLGLQKDQLANRPAWAKGLNLVSKWFRAAALSSPVTFAKLAMATVQQGLVHPLDEMAGSIYSKVIPALDKKAPVQGGGFSAAMSAKAISDGIIKGWGDLRDTLSKAKGFKSDLDAIYGKNGLSPEALEFFGLLHGAEKAPLKRALFSYAMEKQTAYALKNGLDVTDPGVQARMGMEAYKYANRGIFQEQNWVSDMYSRALSRLSEKNKITGRPSILLTGAEAALRSALPVTKVGTNIVFQAFERAFGTGQGAFELARAYRDGFENMKPEEADIILRHLKRGSVGAAILAAGFFMPEIFGGFYRKGEKRDQKDVAVGEIKSPVELPKFVSKTGNIPAYALHGPAIEVAQLGSTLRRVADSKLRKRDTETQGLTNGALAAGLGLVAETPFVKETLDQAKMFEPGGAPNVIGNFAQGAIPQVVQFAARHMDQDAEGNTIKRKPDGILQQIEMGIPTLRNTLPQSGAPLSDKPISRMLEIAQEFKAKNGDIAPDPERYKNLRYALEQKDDAAATKQINSLLEKTDANKLLNGFRESLMAPFTGSKVNDYKLSQILTPEDAATLKQAQLLRRDSLRRFGALLQKANDEQRAKAQKN